MQKADGTQPNAPDSTVEQSPSPRALSPAAQRAIAEAAERRRQMEEKAQPAAEIGGRDGPDPVRYGDWEVNGIASDF